MLYRERRLVCIRERGKKTGYSFVEERKKTRYRLVDEGKKTEVMRSGEEEEV